MTVRLVMAVLCLQACSSRQIIGVQAADDDAAETDSSDTDPAETDTMETDSTTDPVVIDLPLVLDFDESDHGVNVFDDPQWNWNSADGTFDVDVTFTQSPRWLGMEYVVARDVLPRGVDMDGATTIEYRFQTLQADDGYAKLYIQSIADVAEPTDDDWLWYEEVIDPQPGAGWVTRSIDLSAIPSERLNLRQAAKFGLQVHAPGADRPVDDTDTTAPVTLDTPIRIRLQIDSITVR